MNILNIDAFVEPKRELMIAGTLHAVAELDVKSFMANLSAAEALEEQGKDARASKHFGFSLEMVRQAIPTLSDAELGTLSVSRVGVILAFVRGELDGNVAPAGEGAEKKLD